MSWDNQLYSAVAVAWPMLSHNRSCPDAESPCQIPKAPVCLADMNVKPDVYSEAYAGRSSTVLLELPIAIVERAHLPRLEPTRDAVEVECVLCLLARSM